jgi:hypothetical protein
MPAAHSHGDARTCGATTVVIGNSTTYVDGKLWAVQGDINTDDNGQLIPSGSTVYVQGKLVIVHAPDDAEPDEQCLPLGGEHCEPKTAEGSGATFAYG